MCVGVHTQGSTNMGFLRPTKTYLHEMIHSLYRALTIFAKQNEKNSVFSPDFIFSWQDGKASEMSFKLLLSGLCHQDPRICFQIYCCSAWLEYKPVSLGPQWHRIENHWKTMAQHYNSPLKPKQIILCGGWLPHNNGLTSLVRYECLCFL